MSWLGKKTAEPVAEVEQSEKKGRPTPTRQEAEKARRERIKPVLNKKEARRRARQQRFLAQEKAAIKEANRPLNTLMRNYIDSRKFMLSEFVMPVFLILLILSFFTAHDEFLRYFMAYLMWGVMIFIAVEQRLHWVRFRKIAQDRYPNESRKGIWFYGFNRSLSPRRIRRPLPKVKRGESI